MALFATSDMLQVIVSGRAEDEKQATELLNPIVDELNRRLSANIADKVYGYGDANLPKVVAQLLDAQGLKLAILDTITQGVIHGILGGLLARKDWNESQNLSDSCVWIDKGGEAACG